MYAENTSQYVIEDMMEDAPVTSASVTSYVATPTPTEDGVPQGNVQTLPPQATNLNAFDRFINGIESLWTSAYPILVTTGALPNPQQPQPTATTNANLQANNQQNLLILALAATVVVLAMR